MHCDPTHVCTQGARTLPLNEELPYLSAQGPCERVSFDAAAERSKSEALANPTISLIARRQGAAANPCTPVQVLHDYSGGKQAYGVIGMQRDDPRNRLRQKEGFSMTYARLSNSGHTPRPGVSSPPFILWDRPQAFGVLVLLAQCQGDARSWRALPSQGDLGGHRVSSHGQRGQSRRLQGEVIGHSLSISLPLGADAAACVLNDSTVQSLHP